MRKNEKIKSKKKDKKKLEKKIGKKKKRGLEGVFLYHPRRAQKLIFHTRIVKRNRNEIQAQKKSGFEHPTKTKKMKENERI